MIAVSATLVDVPDLSNGPPAWSNLLDLGFLTALSAAVVAVARRQSRAAAVAEMAGFGLILAGVLVALSGGMTSGWGMSNTEGFRIEAGVGLWTCLSVDPPDPAEFHAARSQVGRGVFKCPIRLRVSGVRLARLARPSARVARVAGTPRRAPPDSSGRHGRTTRCRSPSPGWPSRADGHP